MAFAHGHRLALVAVGVIVLTSAFIVEVELGNPLMDTIGLTLFYLGSGALLVALLPLRLCGPVSAMLGDIGRRSYSIYLWHVAARDLVYIFPVPMAVQFDHSILGIPAMLLPFHSKICPS